MKRIVLAAIAAMFATSAAAIDRDDCLIFSETGEPNGFFTVNYFAEDAEISLYREDHKPRHILTKYTCDNFGDQGMCFIPTGNTFDYRNMTIVMHTDYITAESTFIGVVDFYENGAASTPFENHRVAFVGFCAGE